MAAESGCVLHRQQRLSTSSVDKDEWNDFNGFETTQIVQSSVSDRLTGGCSLPENCANSFVSVDSVGSAALSAAEASCLLHDAIERCFCRSSQDATNNLCAHTSSPVLPESQDSIVSNSRYGKNLIEDSVAMAVNATPKAHSLLQWWHPYHSSIRVILIVVERSR